MMSNDGLTLPEVGRQPSWWLREAVNANPDDAGVRRLDRDIEADVVIVGGGYVGMWTAHFLLEKAPDLKVVVLEQDECGSGASGRNGGIVSGWWDELPRLVDLFGPSEAVRACRALDVSIREIGAWCENYGVDAWYAPGGCLSVATAPAQEGRWTEAVELARALGAGDKLVELSQVEVQRRCASPAFGGGSLMATAATVHPARLARGLRRVLLERGVEIFEDTHVDVPQQSGSCVAVTPDGSVTARTGVAAINAWGAEWPVLRRLTVARGSYMVITEPIPHLLEDLGWTGGECFTDSRTAVHYFRTTRDGRIAFGGGGASTSLGSRIGRTHTHDRQAVQRTAEGFRRLFPTLDGVRLEDAWGGPIDVGPFHLPVFRRLDHANWWFGIGYTGNGVGPGHLSGKILSTLCLDQQDEWSELPMANWRPQRYPPEPFRSIGAKVINAAVIRKDRQEEQRDEAGVVTNFVARLPAKFGYRLPPE